MLTALVLNDEKIMGESSYSSQMNEIHELVANGIKAQEELVDVVIINGTRGVFIVNLDNNYYVSGLQETIANYGLGKIKITLAKTHITRCKYSKLEEKGELKFLTDERPKSCISYRLEWEKQP